LAWKNQSQAFTDAAAYRQDRFNLTGDFEPEPLTGLSASRELLNVLGVSPVVGRAFDEQEQRGNHTVALISHGLWTRRYGSDPHILDRTIRLNEVDYSVVGVLPRGFQFPPFHDTDLIVPVTERACLSCGYIRAIARLKPGVPASTAQQQLDLVAARLERAFPDSNEGRGVNVVPLQEVAVGAVRPPLLVLLAAGVFVLLIGCGNVGNLILAGGIFGVPKRSDLATRFSAALLNDRQRLGRTGLLATAGVLGAASVVVFAIAPLRTVAQSRPAATATAQESRVLSALNHALYEAAEDADMAAIDGLVNAGANVNAKLLGDGSPLIAAARSGHLAVVQQLLDRGADPNMAVLRDGSPLIVAALNGHLAVVQQLLDRSADPNMAVLGDGNPLIMAARDGHADVVTLLLDREASIDHVVPGDENALIQASRSGHLDVVKLLVARGADVNARVWAESNGGEWRTPLAMARRGGHDAVVA
jgi:hypothetical protein